MRKKGWIIGLVVVLALGLAGGAAYWRIFRKLSKRPIAECLPANTLFFATLRNATATLLKYQTSHLKEVLESKEVKDLEALIGEKLSSSPKRPLSAQDQTELKALGASFVKSLSGESFLAVTKVDPGASTNPCEMVFGVRSVQGAGPFDDFVARLKQFVARKGKAPQTSQEKKGKYSYEWWEPVPNKIRVCFAKVDDWAIVSLGEPSLHDFMDRYAHSTAAADSLKQRPSFQDIQKRLGSDSDVFAFVNLEEIAGKLFGFIEKQPVANSKQTAAMLRESYKPFVAFGMGARFAGRDITDRWVVLAPKDKRPDLGASYQPCAYQTLAFTSSDTLLYGAQNMDWRKQFDNLRGVYRHGAPQVAQVLDQVNANLAKMGLDLNKNILDALGPEISFQLDWPAQADIPEVVLLVQIGKKDDFKPTAAFLTQLIKSKGGPGVSETKLEQNDLLTLAIPPVPQISPTLLLNDHFMGVFLTQDGARRILTKPATNTLSADVAFQGLTANRKNGSSALCYANTPRLIHKTYAAVKSALPKYAARLPPLQKALGNSSLPDKLSFAEACGPWLMVTKVDDQAFETESISGVGNLILPVSFAGGMAAAIGTPAFMKARTTAMAAKQAAEAEKAEKEVSPETIRNDLQELRVVIEAWAKNQSVAKDTAVQWEQLSGSFIPGSNLEKSRGMDRLGNPYVLGVVGKTLADVSPATKMRFAGSASPDFWTPAAVENKNNPSPGDSSPKQNTPVEVPAGDAGKGPPTDPLKKAGSSDEGLDKYIEK
ncbi:MAG: hypothetical protein HY360_00295 [Verrucomicrobia bacterium]|nr:hypothetical protein [Verrucomicrobiota bacterium]